MGPPEPETGAPAETLPPQADLAAVLARIDDRLAALEAARGGTDTKPSEDDVARLAWAVKHGRQRPW